MASFLRASSAILSFSSNPIAPLDDSINAPFLENKPWGSFWTGNTVLTVVGTSILLLLILEQSNYRSKKSWLPGDNWTVPIIGQFLNSLHPTLENYQKQWDMGPLSALSVFNMCVPWEYICQSYRFPHIHHVLPTYFDLTRSFIVMASSNQHARKIFNSPVHAEPCLVHAAKTVLEPNNWVFLNGKAHSDYRRMLNSLFTRKSLA